MEQSIIILETVDTVLRHHYYQWCVRIMRTSSNSMAIMVPVSVTIWNGRVLHCPKELIPITMAAFLWDIRWAGKTFQFICDNETVVAVLNKLFAKEKRLKHLLRCLICAAVRHSFLFTVKHIAGKNTLADGLSRNNISLFFSQASKGMWKDPEVIPPELPLLYTDSQIGYQKPGASSSGILCRRSDTCHKKCL